MGRAVKYIADEGLSEIPLLSAKGVARSFKIGFVPQYLVFDTNSVLVHKSIGVTSAVSPDFESRFNELISAVPHH